MHTVPAVCEMSKVDPLREPAGAPPPAELATLRAWVCWRYEQHPGDKKPRKVPHYADGSVRRGTQGSPADRAALVTYAEARAAAARHGSAGVGLAMLSEHCIVALDFDNCTDENGAIDSTVLDTVAGTYAEVSPSGRGVRAFFRGALPDRKSASTADAFGFEVFHAKGFVTFTGALLVTCLFDGSDQRVADLTPAALALVGQRFGPGGAGHNAARTEGGAGATGALDLMTIGRTEELARVDETTAEHLRSALEHLAGSGAERGGYDDWQRIGQALKPLGDDVGLPLWLDYSAACPDGTTDDPDEKRAGALAKWDQLRGDRVSYVSIFKRAQAAGWVNPNAGRRPVQVASAGSAGSAFATYDDLLDRTDTGNANMLRTITEGNLRFVAERRLWLWWDGAGWTPDESGATAQRQALLVAKHYLDGADDLARQVAASPMDDDERKRALKGVESLRAWGHRCRSKGALDAMLALSSRDPRVLVSTEDLDRDPWLLGVANGVVDLRTGTLRGAAREDFVTKRSPHAYRPGSSAARWQRFVAEITGAPIAAEVDSSTGDVKPETVGRFAARPALAAYLQRALGYAMTGSTAEQKMFVAVGEGSNGKNILLDVVQAAAGDYWRTIPPEALMATRHDADAERPSPTAASLAGARAAVSSESRDGAKLDVALVKRHTGGGFMTARLLRENTFRFPITHKVILMTNHRPGLDHMDEAMRGRLHLIPFDRVWNRPGHPERDPGLPDGDKGLMVDLQGEAEGVLAWLIRGAVEYHRDGLEPPAEVLTATRAYFSEQDDLGQWLEGFLRCDPGQGISSSDLFSRFGAWCAARGRKPLTPTAFGISLKRRGVPNKRDREKGILYGLAPAISF